MASTFQEFFEDNKGDPRIQGDEGRARVFYEAERNALAKQTQSEGLGAQLDQGLSWLRNKVDEGARRVDTAVGLSDPGKGVLENVNPIPATGQGLAGLLASFAASGLMRGTGAASMLGRGAAVPAAETLAGSVSPSGIDATQLGVDTVMNSAPELIAGGRTAYRHLRPAATLQPDDVNRAVEGINRGLDIPSYLRSGDSPRETVAGISNALTPAHGENSARSVVNSRYERAQGAAVANAGDPWLSVPDLSDKDIKLSQALQGLRNAQVQIAQGSAVGGIQGAPGNKDAVLDAASIRTQIYRSLRERGFGSTAHELDVRRGQERRGLGTQEVYTGMTPQGQQFKPLTERGTLDMGELQKSLRAAVADGRLTAEEADNLFRSNIRRDAAGMDTNDILGKFNLGFIRINPGGKIGMSQATDVHKNFQMPQTIGSPDRLGALNVPSNGQYNPMSMLLGQILQGLSR